MCGSCPRQCKVDREFGNGYCGVGDKPKVAKAFLHKWEEPCISGINGSGTVFFSGCNLKCVFCQNYDISQKYIGKEISIEELSKIYLKLQQMGANNINLVNPTHYAMQIKKSLEISSNLKIPVIYNTNAYETINVLKEIEGMVDVYLPDFKYIEQSSALRYSGVQDYFEVAAEAIEEMYRQVGGPVFDENGLIKRGLIIRHLILPGLSRESMKILDYIKDHFPKDVYISLMSQYTPCFNAENYPEINRRITRSEYDRVLNHFFKLGFENGYVQERESASVEYIPEFDFEGIEG